MSLSGRLVRWQRNRRLRRQAGIRTWTRPLGGSGLPAEAEAWVMQIEDQLRMTEARISDGAAELERGPVIRVGRKLVVGEAPSFSRLWPK